MDQRLSASTRSRPHRQQADYLPPPNRLAMPEQELWGPSRGGRATPGHAILARWMLFLTCCLATGAFAWTLYKVLSVEAPTPLQLAFWVLSTICFALVSIGSMTALIGFVVLMWRGCGDTLVLPDAPCPPRGRTALLFPVYREDPVAVSASIDAMCRDILATSASSRFDVFILSDTQDKGERQYERRIYLRLSRSYAQRMGIYARWRTPNTAKKAGNISNWIETFGGDYPYFVILDADSIMSAATLLRLARAMDVNPRTALIQTVPRIAGGESWLARLQQFAACYYGRLVAAGLAAWHGPGGNYWGHNAIIRTTAFAASCGLPPLKGAPPLGGHILSHDFVEAALLRRAGWEVHMVPSLDGSFEGCPPELGDLITRDRRWAQGNLQHLRLLNVRGLPFLSRLHLGLGAFAYLASPVWALTLLVGVVLAVQATYATPAYFGNETSLFPKWPVFDAQLALSLFIATIIFVHLPKLLGVVWGLWHTHQRRQNGGVARLLGGLVVESVMSTLMAPILMVAQTSAVLATCLGRDAGWNAQRRVQASMPFAQFLRRYRWHTFWGALGAAVCWAISPAVLAWMSPIILGLLLAAPIAQITGRRAPVAAATLLATDLERDIPPLLASQALRRREWEALCRTRA